MNIPRSWTAGLSGPGSFNLSIISTIITRFDPNDLKCSAIVLKLFQLMSSDP